MDFVSILLSGQSLTITNESTGLPVWTRISPVSAEITSPAETTQFPLAGTAMQVVEVSSTSSVSNLQAAKVIMPAHMALNVICNDQSTIENIINTFDNDEVTFSITSRSIIASKMSMSDVEITQSEENLNGVSIVITFEQTSFSIQGSFDPKQSADESSNGVAIKEPVSLTTTVSSLYNKIKSTVGI